MSSEREKTAKLDFLSPPKKKKNIKKKNCKHIFERGAFCSCSPILKSILELNGTSSGAGKPLECRPTVYAPAHNTQKRENILAASRHRHITGNGRAVALTKN